MEVPQDARDAVRRVREGKTYGTSDAEQACLVVGACLWQQLRIEVSEQRSEARGGSFYLVRKSS